MTLRIALLISALTCSWVAADPVPSPSPSPPPSSAPELPVPEQPAKSASPAVEKLDETHFRIGQVSFDRKTREIRFPTKLNMTEGLLEFLIVHENGKVHEALLVTAISPTHLNLAFTLLRYPASRELYALPNETGGLSDKYPEVPAEIKAGARIAIDVEWSENGRTRRCPANDWIQHAVKSTPMPAGSWVYGGSVVEQGKFVPESTGDIIAIFTTASALINYPGEDHGDDTVWIPYTKRVPAAGTDITVIISPNNSQSPSKP